MRTILLVSGLLGALCGGLLVPTPQDVIEPAQVLAGIVSYGADDVVYLYATHTWTVLHQLTAAALLMGVSEWTLSLVWSALIGMLAFQTVALTARAAGASTVIAALCPLLIWTMDVTLFPSGYRTLLVGTAGTYGQIANPYLLLMPALLALEKDRAAALGLGLFPGVHIAAGAWSWVLVAGLALWRPALATRLLAQARWFAAGLLITIASAGLHVWWAAPARAELTNNGAAVMREARHLDSHRGPASWEESEYLAMLALPFLTLGMLRRLPHLTDGARLLAVSFATATAIRVAADLVIRLAPDTMAMLIERPMPERLLTLPSLGFAAWLIGVGTGTTGKPRVVLLSSASVCLLALWALVDSSAARLVSAASWLYDDPVRHDILGLAAAIAGVLVVAAGTLGHATALPRTRTAATAVRTTLVALLCALVVKTIVTAAGSWHQHVATVFDRTNGPVLHAASRGSGLLLTALELTNIQGSTRRPVLLDLSVVSSLAYVPQAAERTDHIMRRVYGRGIRRLPDDDPDVWDTDDDELTRELWRDRTVAQWLEIRAEFGVTEVLVPAEWRLQLPLVATGDHVALYAISAISSSHWQFHRYRAADTPHPAGLSTSAAPTGTRH